MRMEFVKGPDNSRQEKLTRLIMQHEKELLRMCCVYLGDVVLAEDAVQETFLKAYKKMDGFRGECSEKTWLIRIALNVCKDMRGTSWFRFVNRNVDFERLEMPVQFVPEDQLALTEAIMKLPHKYREVVYLYYDEGLKLREIADILHLSASSVSRRLEKAKDRLKEILEGGMDDE